MTFTYHSFKETKMKGYTQIGFGFSVLDEMPGKKVIKWFHKDRWYVYLYDDGSIWLTAEYRRSVGPSHVLPADIIAKDLHAPKYAKKLVQKAQDYWRNY
jgi:hypothetical protein